MTLSISRLLSTTGCAIATAVSLAAGQPQAPAPPTSTPVPAIPNDNRSPAGHMQNGVLTLHLEVVMARWSPDAGDGATRTTQAFAEQGRAPSVPGPLIRVRAGTEIDLSVHNGNAEAPLRLYGLMDRPAADDAMVEVGPGAAREWRFRAGVPGTYFYWGTTTGATLNSRLTVDSQLAGAFVVDPAGPENRINDRIFVLTEWLDLSAAVAKVSEAINGASWPHTDRLTLPFGQPVEWRIINASAAVHPMHLHGTFYTVESRGTAGQDTIYGADGRRLVTTERMDQGTTMMMRWVPDRVGNWLFHCHILQHVSADMKLGDLSPTERSNPPAHAEHDIDHAMAGLVIGLTVLPGDETAAPDLDAHVPRRVTLTMQQTPNRYGAESGYGFAIAGPPGFAPLPPAPPPPSARNDPGAAPVRPPAPSPSPTLVLTKGEPVIITLANQMDKATQIHWHGMELESYNDGVAGWSGNLRQVTPLIEPGTSYDVRFNPPRAGTFIYHTHSHDQQQLVAGLYGALIVMEPGTTFDPNLERIVLIGGPPGRTQLGLEVNRSSNPPPIDLKAGAAYRFRLINITANLGAMVSIGGDRGPLEWRAVAKDGADLPPAQATLQRSQQVLAVGETYDFEFTPKEPGELRLDVRRIGGNATMTTTLIRVAK